MRASGAFAAEHIFTAFATSPARMHFCIVARNTSLLMDEPNRYNERSTMMPIVRIDQNRMGHMPHPPSLNASYAPCIASVLQFASRHQDEVLAPLDDWLPCRISDRAA